MNFQAVILAPKLGAARVFFSGLTANPTPGMATAARTAGRPKDHSAIGIDGVQHKVGGIGIVWGNV